MLLEFESRHSKILNPEYNFNILDFFDNSSALL